MQINISIVLAPPLIPHRASATGSNWIHWLVWCWAPRTGHQGNQGSNTPGQQGTGEGLSGDGWRIRCSGDGGLVSFCSQKSVASVWSMLPSSVPASEGLNNVERREQNFSDSSAYLLADESRGEKLIAWDQELKKCSWSLVGGTALEHPMVAQTGSE